MGVSKRSFNFLKEIKIMTQKGDYMKLNAIKTNKESDWREYKTKKNKVDNFIRNEK